MKLTILDGPDGSGKSTLIQRRLKENPHLNIISGGAARETQYETFKCLLEQLDCAYALRKWEDVILDRSLFSFMAYERALGTEFSEQDEITFDAVINQMLALDAEVIICIPNYDKWVEVIKREKQDNDNPLYNSVEFQSVVRDEYLKIAKKYNLTILETY